LRIVDTEVQRYLQRFPYATGPDKEMNQRCVAVLPNAINLCMTTAEEPEIAAVGADARNEWQDRAIELLALFRSDSREIGKLVDEYGWKVAAIPSESRRILSIGCGDGSELAVMRSMFPEAEINAIDWECKIPLEVLHQLRVQFNEASFIDRLSIEMHNYDVIFSNHVLEHLYDPENTLHQLLNWLRPGGVLVSALPMDAAEEAPFSTQLAKVVKSQRKIAPIDLSWIDLGHPWKTNPSNLNYVLTTAGYTNIQLFQRAHHPSRFVPGDRAQLKRLKMVALLLDSMVLGVPRAVFRLWKDPSHQARKLFYAVESRLWFGRGRLKNLLSPEILCRAERPS
jgi:2-polyprenyl-3-methyl-5-hydroxy-6-metoxy-1,4-benzoquinol methylase